MIFHFKTVVNKIWAFLQLFDLSFSSILPPRVWLSLFKLTVEIYKFPEILPSVCSLDPPTVIDGGTPSHWNKGMKLC